MQLYSASEGFFGIQDERVSNEMLLMLDYGIYYEFIPVNELGKENPRTYHLSEVQKDKNYAMLISTNAVSYTHLDVYKRQLISFIII